MKPVKKRNKPVLCSIELINRTNTNNFGLLSRFGANRAVVSLHGVDHVLHDLLYHRPIKKKSTWDFRTVEIHVIRPVCIECIASYCKERRNVS